MTSRLADTARRRSALAAVGLVAVLGAGLALAGTPSAGDRAAAGALPAPRFVDEAAAAGVDHVYDGDLAFFVGGGVAVLDCDDDGRPELYLAGGSRPSALYRNRSPVGGPLRFTRHPDPVTDLEAVAGAYPLDVDDDGRIDLVVLRVGENVVLRGLGDCRFERANEAWGVDGGETWTTAFSATWEAGARRPTLAFGAYVELTEADRAGERCSDSVLLRPDGPGGRYGRPLALRPAHCALSLLFSDWGRSGRRDLRVSNDRHYDSAAREQLFRIEPGELPRPYTTEDGWQPLQLWGMGIASRDLTGDGRPEVYLTSQGDNKLQELVDESGRPHYRDTALSRGATAHRPFTGGDVLPSTAWHPEFGDVNLDGLVDLLVTKGNVEAQPGHAVRDPTNLLLGRPDGTFEEGAEAAGIVRYDRARGGALVDLDLDGLLDLVVVHRRAPAALWRNLGAGDGPDAVADGHWIAVRPVQGAPNRDALGAWLEVRAGGRTWWHEVTVGGGHAGGQLGWIHVGLGPADDPELRVQWPDGEVGPWQDLPLDAFAVVERGASDVRPWTPQDP